ncbi:MAG: MBL fold metallo-hydrolase [Nocardioidaceae bacterium]
MPPRTSSPPGAATSVGDLRVEAVGGRHARNHDQIPPLGNIGLIVTDRGGRRLFHPGDSYDETPGDIAVLALPLNAPWCRMSETLDFLRAVSPEVAIPIHDGLLSEPGHAAYLMHLERFGPTGTTVRRLTAGEPFDA